MIQMMLIPTILIFFGFVQQGQGPPNPPAVPQPVGPQLPFGPQPQLHDGPRGHLGWEPQPHHEKIHPIQPFQGPQPFQLAQFGNNLVNEHQDEVPALITIQPDPVEEVIINPAVHVNLPLAAEEMQHDHVIAMDELTDTDSDVDQNVTAVAYSSSGYSSSSRFPEYPTCHSFT